MLLTGFPSFQEFLMDAFTTLKGLVAPLDRVNVDTDQIIPKQYLKTIKRTGLREGSFSISHAIKARRSCWRATILVADRRVSMRHGRCWIMDSVALSRRASLIS